MMPWVRFTDYFTFVPATRQMVSIVYKPGMVLLVTTECAERAILKGRAVRTTKPMPVRLSEIDAANLETRKFSTFDIEEITRTLNDDSGRPSISDQVRQAPQG